MSIEIENLNKVLDQIDKIGDKEWMGSLNDRKLKELQFHDRDRDSNHIEKSKANDTYEKFYGNKKYYSTTIRSKDFVNKWIKKESKNKVFLDYACGNGFNAIMAAECGASLSLGFDISGVSVQNARKSADEKYLKNIRFFQADAENTMLPDNCIDTVICSGMLHHLDLNFAFPELKRILKPGGKILAVEALDYNPLIKIYRLLTPDMRTEWEKGHILSLKDVKFAKKFFEIGNINYWHITSYAGAKFPFLLNTLDKLDRVLEKIPLVRLMSWIFTFELIKKRD